MTAALFSSEDDGVNDEFSEVETYELNTTDPTTIKIYNDLKPDDGDALYAFLIFLFVLVLLGLCLYHASPIKLWFRQRCLFPCRRICCEGERRRLWALHREAVVHSDDLASSPMVEMTTDSETAVTLSDPLEAQLDSLVGLEPLKDEIRALRRTLVVEQQRFAVSKRKNNAAKKTKATAPHMVFRGSPGTGKTHAARLIARLLKELGYVHGDIVEVQRADLVAGYVGQTALKTRAVINKAKGGVLFVDEAYALAPKGAGEAGRDFGAEAVQELMRDLTTGDPVVVLAGYPEEMEHFLRINPGLSRRFQVRFTFPDYSMEQLAQIFLKMAKRNDYALEGTNIAELQAIMAANFDATLCRKWNGGLPEGLFRRSKDALAKRLNVRTMSPEAAHTLTKDDIVNGARILAATLDEARIRHQPVASTSSAPPPRQQAIADDGDDEEDIYGETSRLLQNDNGARISSGNNRHANPNTNSLEHVIAALSTGGLQQTVATVQDLQPRIAALEAAVSRLTAAAAANSSSSSPALRESRANNPWSDQV